MNNNSKFSKEDIHFRKAEGFDIAAMKMLEEQLGYPIETVKIIQRFEEILAAGDVIMVAEFRSKVIGMILLHRTYFLHRPPDGRISTLVVDEKFRGSGIGKLLLDKAEAVFLKWGCRRIEVTSGKDRIEAHNFYMKAGYNEYPKRFRKLLYPDAI
ncbi:hypothetical protein BH10BAC5_BH10BAC5_06970 [soil metagenome]